MSAFCGLCSSSTYKRAEQKPLIEKWGELKDHDDDEYRNRAWARDDQLSAIIELDSTKGTPQWEKTESEANNPAASASHKTHFLEIVEEEFRAPVTPKGKGLQYPTHSDRRKTKRPPLIRRVSNMSGRTTPSTPRAIQPPPKDLEAISRIDASLIFEHFTTQDAWLLGSALRERLLPIPTPVVINISLANQNQTLFHTCTHSGVMPDNDSWVSRKRKTVLRWGVSTWYMHCKFGGDEVAFKEKYGLGNSAGDYAIHGGGVPIRVTGVEGVVAVVVVSGLKQNEDHGVIVEVIRELYY